MNRQFNTEYLTSLLNKYKESVNTDDLFHELEIRFKNITFEAFSSVIKYAEESPEFSDPQLDISVNIISKNVFERSTRAVNDNTQYIRRLVYDNQKVVDDQYIHKNKLMGSAQIKDYINYSIGLSSEKTTSKFIHNTSAFVRFKLRLSFDYIGASRQPAQWRFDITAVKQGSLKDLGPNFEYIKKQLIVPAMTSKTFLRELNLDQIDNFEIEIEHIGDKQALTVESLNIVKKIYTMINPEYVTEIAYQEEIFNIANYIIKDKKLAAMFKRPTHRLKQLLNQVVTVSKNTYYSNVWPPKGYYLTDKADGQRAIVTISNTNRVRAMLSDRMIELSPGNDEPSDSNIIIVDSELIKDTFYIFDVLVMNNNNVSTDTFGARIVHCEEAAKTITELFAKHKVKFEAKCKEYVLLDDNYEKAFNDVYKKKRVYEIDGLILVEPGEPYRETRNYKWKPLSHNTIDFLAIKCPSKLLGVKPYTVKPGYTLYLLFVGINDHERKRLGLGFIPQYHNLFPTTDKSYYPIQFSPSVNPLAYLYYHPSADKTDIENKIIELSLVDSNWNLVRVRTDRKMEKRYFGNDFRIAELTYVNYIDPFNLEDLWKSPSNYFIKTSGVMYTAPNKFKRFVISMILKNNMSGSKHVIDLAGGRGADMHRYKNINVEHVLFIDIDPTAIAELIRRKFSFFTKARPRKGAHEVLDYEKTFIKDTKNLTIHTLVADLKSDPADLITSTFQFGYNKNMVNGIVCNFALHYMCDTIEHLRNVLVFVSSMLIKGGVFIFTVMDGASVFALLKNVKTGQQWEARENNVLKYAIRKDYSGTKLTSAGQNISVLLPFSNEMYTEPLCNIKVVTAEAKKLGLTVEINESMSKYSEVFAKADRALYDRLTEEDNHYIGLHHIVTMRKTK